MRSEFPAFEHWPDLVYLDSAATTLVPRRVLQVLQRATALGGSAHRSLHPMGLAASSQYEAARSSVADHIGAEADEIVFVRSATEGLNAIARGWGEHQIGPRDEIVVTISEHHSNLLPWRALAERTGAVLKVATCTASGDLDLDAFTDLLGPRTRLVAATHVSNITGAVSPIQQMAARIGPTQALFVVDGAQAIAHLDVDVRELGCDAYVFSGHKVYASTGVGVVWSPWWGEMRPCLQGGGTVSAVTDRAAELLDGPARFEAGTPHGPGVVALAEALRFSREARTTDLAPQAADALQSLSGVRLIGMPTQRVGAVSFVVDHIHPHDLGTFAADRGVSLRVGHMCAQPLLRRFGVSSAVRASFGVYNTPADIDALIETITAAQALLARP